MVECVGGDASGMVGALSYWCRLAAVFVIAAGDALDVGAGCQQNRRCGALLDRLLRRKRKGCRFTETGQVVGAHVARQRSTGDVARHQRINRDAIILPALRGADSEQDVGGLGLAVGRPLVVGAEPVVQVVKDDRRE